jgi:hypothetical protein
MPLALAMVRVLSICRPEGAKSEERGVNTLVTPSGQRIGSRGGVGGVRWGLKWADEANYMPHQSTMHGECIG